MSKWTNADSVIAATHYDDIIYGVKGDDKISGNAGDDIYVTARRATIVFHKEKEAV